MKVIREMDHQFNFDFKSVLKKDAKQIRTLTIC